MTEFRTRVAGWEEPCHPGSKVHEHACPTLPHFFPLCNPTVIGRPTKVLVWPLRRVQADSAWRSGVSRDCGRLVGDCTIPCSSLNWARACKIGAIPSERCARVPAIRQPQVAGFRHRSFVPLYAVLRTVVGADSGDGGELEHEPCAPIARRRGEPAAVVARNRRGDRQPATTRAPATARATRQLCHRCR